MEQFRQYLISIISAALVAGSLGVFINKDSSQGKLIRLISGLFIALTILAPLTKIGAREIYEYFDGLDISANAYVYEGQSAADDAMREIIKSKSEAYILDKATALGAQLSVEVSLGDDSPPIPTSVRIEGEISPYIKATLSGIITKDIGIAKGDQIWI